MSRNVDDFVSLSIERTEAWKASRAAEKKRTPETQKRKR
jgi:hypothetical protein